MLPWYGSTRDGLKSLGIGIWTGSEYFLMSNLFRSIPLGGRLGFLEVFDAGAGAISLV